jgi:branched-chain amino acid transport system ATP-binding protein
MNAAALALENERAGYGETVVLEGVSLLLPAQDSLAVLGRNGVGKTTLLATIMGHTTLHGGDIRLGGRLVSRLAPHRRPALGLGWVPQEREVFRSLTVEEHLAVAARPGRWTMAGVLDLFPALGARRQHYGNELSGGEQQMLAIGRALMGNPSVLLMDEPLEGLAPVIVDVVLAAIERLKCEHALAILLVEQHARLALAATERAIVLDRGKIVHEGASAELRNAPERLAGLMGVERRMRAAGTSPLSGLAAEGGAE